jgi:hypothetical protein
MGTSKGISTPSGGGWRAAKRTIKRQLANPGNGSAAGVVAAVVSAAGGLGLGIRHSRGAGGGGASGARGGGGRSAADHAKQVGGAVAGLSGFASAVREQGLAEALRGLDLTTLEGRPAVEVIARVSERLAEGLDGVDGEILRTALNATILEAAQLEQELGFTDLEVALQTFLNEQGLSGLVELFLSRLAADFVVAAILDYVDQKTNNEQETEAMVEAIEVVCREKARAVIGRYDGRMNQVDWFGRAGARIGREIAESIVDELIRTD